MRVSPPPGDPVVIDGGDRACVRLLLELRARISGLPAGTVIHLVASDLAEPAARRPLTSGVWSWLRHHFASAQPQTAARWDVGLESA